MKKTAIVDSDTLTAAMRERRAIEIAEKNAAEARSKRRLEAEERYSVKKNTRLNLPSIINQTEHVDTSPEMLSKAANRANEQHSQEQQMKASLYADYLARLARLVTRLEKTQHAVCWNDKNSMVEYTVDRLDENTFKIQQWMLSKEHRRYTAGVYLEKDTADTAEYLLRKQNNRIK